MPLPSSKIIDFYSDDPHAISSLQSGEHHKVLTYTGFLSASFEALEANHTYVQTVFPTIKPSGACSNAPILDDTVIRQFKTDPILKQKRIDAFT